MAYLHCHSCDFSQDDFWHEGYNPIRFLYKNYEKSLLSDELDEIVPMDKWWLKEQGVEFVTNRDIILMKLKNMITTITNMKYPRQKDWDKVKQTAVCPKCLKRDWDID